MDFRLHPYQPDDAPCIVSWLKDEKAFDLWSAGRYSAYPLTAEAMNACLEKASADPSAFAFTMTDGEGKTAGHLRMQRLSPSEVRFFANVVDDTRRGQGLGKALLTLAEQYAFETLHVSRITISVFKENAPALACYNRLGYRVIGEDAPALSRGISYARLLAEKRKDI